MFTHSIHHFRVSGLLRTQFVCKHCFLNWQRDNVSCVRGHAFNLRCTLFIHSRNRFTHGITVAFKITMAIKFAAHYLPILYTGIAILACSVPKLRMCKYLLKMAAWLWQIRPKLWRQSTHHIRSTHIRH